jgi:hypothetical protein
MDDSFDAAIVAVYVYDGDDGRIQMGVRVDGGTVAGGPGKGGGVQI